MLLNAETVEGVTIIQLPEKINVSNSRAFERDILPLMNGNSRVIFDLGEVRHLDSSGLGAIIACYKRARSDNGDLKLCGMSKHIRTLFEMGRLHHVFDIYSTKQEALESYK